MNIPTRPWDNPMTNAEREQSIDAVYTAALL